MNKANVSFIINTRSLMHFSHSMQCSFDLYCWIYEGFLKIGSLCTPRLKGLHQKVELHQSSSARHGYNCNTYGSSQCYFFSVFFFPEFLFSWHAHSLLRGARTMQYHRPAMQCSGRFVSLIPGTPFSWNNHDASVWKASASWELVQRIKECSCAKVERRAGNITVVDVWMENSSSSSSSSPLPPPLFFLLRLCSEKS